jgi:FkbM family methyltransferase
VNRLAWTASVWLSRARITGRYAVALPFTYRNWWAVPLPKLGRCVVLELRNGTKYLVRPGTTDLAVVNEAAILNPYLRPPHIVLREDSIVIDIGACIGDFTMQAARACPKGRVIAVEPVRANVAMIETQMSLNRVSNVETVHAAIGADSRSARLTRDGLGSRASALDDRNDLEAVEMMTLEELMEGLRIESVDLLKLDCEGAEWDILPASERILPRVRQISMELHAERGWTAERLAGWLRARGFTVAHTSGAWNGLLWATRNVDCRIPTSSQ